MSESFVSKQENDSGFEEETNFQSFQSSMEESGETVEAGVGGKETEGKEEDLKSTLMSLKEEMVQETLKDKEEALSKREVRKELPSNMRELFLDDLKERSIDDLMDILYNLYDVKLSSYKSKLDILFKIVDSHTKMGGTVYARGVLQVLNDQNQGYGFLRSEEHNYLSGAGDIYVSQTQIRSLGLRTGDEVFGTIRAPLRDNEKYFGLLKVVKVNGKEFTGNLQKRVYFDKLTPMFPTEKFNLEYSKEDIDTRIIDIFIPIGKGQRGLVVSQPKAGK
ncbi:MAG: hypothetical protein ABDH28_05060, partial [Brevinematia bacterium]